MQITQAMLNVVAEWVCMVEVDGCVHPVNIVAESCFLSTKCALNLVKVDGCT